ncbi:MAG: phosphohistidine phosphatase SixA, partial [Burkholderiales bacterium PBB4]
MDLILWRHAEAIEPAAGQPDMTRPLTRRGEKQAAKMAAWLDRQLPDTARIWASPSRRTEQTAAALGRKFKVTEALAPHATVEQLLELAQWPLGHGCVLLVGHQPTLGQTLSQVLGLNAGECVVKKGAVWWIRYREREAEAQSVV